VNWENNDTETVTNSHMALVISETAFSTVRFVAGVWVYCYKIPNPAGKGKVL